MHPLVRTDLMENNADWLALNFNAGSSPGFGALPLDPKCKRLASRIGFTDLMAPSENSDSLRTELLRHIAQQDEKAMVE